MQRARREGLALALLMVVTALVPAIAGAQTPDAPAAPDEAPPAEEPPAVEEPAQPVEEAPGEDPADEPEPAEDDEDWMTSDVEADDEEYEDDDADGESDVDEDDVDEVIIEYDESADKDRVTDAAGKEIEDIPAPVVSKAVKVQDPDQLEPGADKDTGVQGQVVSRRPKKVLPDAPVLAKGQTDGRLRSTLTDDRGRYRLYLPPGKYTLRSYYDLYHGARWDNIAVTRGAFKRVNFVLDPITEKDAGVEEQEVIYTADTTTEAAQLALRKEQVGVQDAISAEEIKRAGDSTAKGAVKRVVGITVDDDGRIIIRGLADRYNRVLLNGVPIPGVDPDVPSVKLDVFPTEVVSNLAIVKVPRPDLPGNFAGGLLLIDTNKYPREQLLKAGVSLGGNSLSTFRNAPTYLGGNRDFLGFDDGTRALPGLVGNNRLDLGNRFESSRYQSRDQLDQVGRSFPAIWNPSTNRALPKIGLKLAAGNSGDLKKGRRAGYLVSFIYEYEELVRTGFNKRFRFNEDGQADGLLRDFDYTRGDQEVLWGTFGSGFLEINRDNILGVTSLFSRISEDTTLVQLGAREATGLDVLTTQNSYNFIGRSVFFNQLTGDHRNLRNSSVRLRWNGTVATGKRDEPDRRLVTQFVEEQRVIGASRFYSDLSQLAVSGNSDIRFPVYKAFERTAYGSIGAIAAFQDRDFTARRFVVQNRPNQALIGDPETTLGPTGLGRLSTMREVTRIDDSYVASNTLYGGFVQLQTPMAEWASFLGLLRFEAFTQRVRSESPFAEAADPSEIRSTDRTDLDPLPSANFKFDINDKMFVKLGYGMTVIRPELRELAPFTYVDFIRGWVITGNENLQRTRVQNAEARYEYFFGDTDLVAATAFFKYLRDPIEFVIFNQVNSSAGYANAEKAWLAGGEVELRLGLGRFHEKLQKLFFLANVAVIGSQTTLPQGEGISGRLQRRLFNQSPFVTNVSLRFDDSDSGVLVALVYNSFGSRIVEAGSSAGDFIIPDVFEKTQHYLDLIVTYQPAEHWKIGFKWKNIAFARVRYEQGDQIVFEKNLGTSVSLSAEYSY